MKRADFDSMVRDLVSDAVSGGEGESYRWTPADLLMWINDGRRELYSVRPEAFYVTDIVTEFPGSIDADADLDILSEYLPQLVNYVCYRCLSRDNEEPEAARLAAEYFQKFIAGA